MKICILGDTHHGMRGDSLEFHRYNKKFYDNIFFPYLIDNKIDTGNIVFQKSFKIDNDTYASSFYENVNSLFLKTRYHIVFLHTS